MVVLLRCPRRPILAAFEPEDGAVRSFSTCFREVLQK